jgi:Phage protein U
MASLPASPAHLMTLGMFLFGMETVPYQDLQRRMSWRHEESERFGARAASQFAGPGEDSIMIAGLIVPEMGATYSSVETLIEMAGTGDNWPLIDGLGRVLGHYRIEAIDQSHRGVMAGGLPRAVDFSMELRRVD